MSLNRLRLFYQDHKKQITGALAALVILTALGIMFSEHGSEDVKTAGGDNDVTLTEESAGSEDTIDRSSDPGAPGNDEEGTSGSGPEGSAAASTSASSSDGSDGSADPQSSGAHPEEIVVDVSGAVKTEKVVRLAYGSRVEDAIEEAGGLTKKADTSTVNRAAVLQDGQKIYIPSEGESLDEIIMHSGGNTSAVYPAAGSSSGSSGASGAGASDGGASSGSDAAGASSSQGMVNINTASLEELQQLTGVGPATAQKIIDYRQTYGSFRSPEDLMEVNGIGEKTFNKMKDRVVV